MFTKIVSQLSLSPSTTSQLVFYARRLKAESVTRTFSALAAVLIVGLQFATIIAPPTASNAASPNDIIYGGFVSKADLLNHYDDSSELKALYNYFGITRQDVVNSHVATISSKDHSLKSIGRIQHLASDEKIAVGSNVYWSRGLYTWDTGANIERGSSYQVLEGTRSLDGGYFAIMFACGNLVYKNLPAKPVPIPPPAPPTPKLIPTPTPKPTAKPTISCLELIGNDTIGSASSTAPLSVSYTGMGSATNQTISEYDFNFGDGTTANLPSSDASHTYSKVGDFIASLKVKGSTGSVSSTPPACTYTVKVLAAPAAYTKSKSALNLTQNIDATAKPANAGDNIRYILTTQNTGATAGQYTVVEHLEDILQYADVTNAGGGTLDNGVMSWPQTMIEPGAALTETFVVTVKNPIPDTPVGVSDKYSYDLQMDNVYGNAVSIAISPPLPKQIEAASASLPDTGASTGTTIVLAVCALTLFFYLRNRQLMSEIKLLRGEYHGGAL
jgi:hypothetical protein